MSIEPNNIIVKHYAGSIEYAEAKDKHIREVLYPKTKLPKKPNIKLAAEVLMTAQNACWGR